MCFFFCSVTLNGMGKRLENGFCVCVFMVCGHLLLALPPSHFMCISVKHLLTSHCDFVHLKNHGCKSVEVNRLRPDT